MSDALDAFRVPLSAIRDADVVAVLGDGPVVERAPVVDLWIKEARRRGARVLYELDEDAVRSADRAILIWCGPGGHGGATVAALAATARRERRLLHPRHRQRTRRLRRLVVRRRR